ncbi:MAG: tetratricopeptide repeat protein [Saprospiraceae bacterium]
MSRYHLLGRFLLEQNRLDEAEREFKKALAEDPQDAIAYMLLAEVYIQGNRFAEALDYSQQAVRLEPEMSSLYFTLSRAYLYNKNPKKAREAIAEGKRLNPLDAHFYLVGAHIAYYEDKWQEALDEAERGLQFDAENVQLINMRAQALVKLNRRAEAGETIDYALKNDPEDSFSHANKGWVLVEKGQYKTAVDSFREALRLNPNNEYARQGLREAIKAQNPLYALILRYFLWSAKLSERGQWFFIIGIYILYRIIVGLSRSIPALQPFLFPFIAAYIIFAFSSWIAKPISNLFLRLHPMGRHALTEDEVKGSNYAGALAFSSLFFLILYFVTTYDLFNTLFIILGVMLIPVSGLFNAEPGTKARRMLTQYAIALGAVGLVAAFVPSATFLFLIFGLGIFAYGWVANYAFMKDAKQFR